MIVCLITECELARTHGTGSQLLEQFDRGEIPYHHLYWRCGHRSKSESDHSTLLAEYELPVPKLRSLPRRLLGLVGRSWWSGEQVNRNRLRALLRREGLNFDVAYVVVGRESDAVRASSILACLGCPYVVRVVDLYHASGLDRREMPILARLLENSSGILALNRPIALELAKITSKRIEEMLDGQPAVDQVATAPADAGPIRVIMGGRPYVNGCLMLAKALPELAALDRPVELISVGPHFQDIPQSLRGHVRDLGFLSDAEYRSVLANSHLAFLSGPAELDCFGKYSFPSRCTDYLMAGLPIVAAVAPGSATEQVLRPLIPDAVASGTTPASIVEAVKRLCQTSRWHAASRLAREFAVQQMEVEDVRRKVFSVLDNARNTRIPCDLAATCVA